MLIVSIIAALAAALLLVIARAGSRLNPHVEMPAEEMRDAVVLWGPWASHDARCSCTVCR